MSDTRLLDDQTNEYLLSALWARFGELASDISADKQRHGRPSALAEERLHQLGDQLDLLESLLTVKAGSDGALMPMRAPARLTLNGQEYAYERDTAEHARWLKAMRYGMPIGDSLVAKERIKLANERQLTPQMKAMALADDTAGGYMASGQFVNDVLRTMSDISPVRQVARVVPITTSSSGLMPVRTGIQTARRISETASRPDAGLSDLSFRLEHVPAAEMYAESIVSRQLVADSRYPLDAELLDAFTSAAQLLEGKEFITGSGAGGEMVGLDNTSLAAANVVTCADSTGHTVSLDDIGKLVFQTIKAAYLPGAKLLMNPKLYGTLRLLKATSGNTYLLGGNDAPGTLFGLPVVFMPDMPANATPAAGNKVVYLVGPGAYALVVRQEIVVLRLTERYAESGQIGYYLFQRVGGQLVISEAIARLVTA